MLQGWHANDRLIVGGGDLSASLPTFQQISLRFCTRFLNIFFYFSVAFHTFVFIFQYLGKKGKVVKIDSDGDVVIRYNDGQRFVYNPNAVAKVRFCNSNYFMFAILYILSDSIFRNIYVVTLWILGMLVYRVRSIYLSIYGPRCICVSVDVSMH